MRSKKCHVIKDEIAGDVLIPGCIAVTVSNDIEDCTCPINYKSLKAKTAMNLDYLVNEILPQRAAEIEHGKNLGTRQPIYIVYDMQEHYCSGHNDFTSPTNKRGEDWEFGYIDSGIEGELREFKKSPRKMVDPTEVSRFYTDVFKGFFFTSEAAHDYMKYQKHNLSKKAYVYVEYSGYGNKQMDTLLNNG